MSSVSARNSRDHPFNQTHYPPKHYGGRGGPQPQAHEYQVAAAPPYEQYYYDQYSESAPSRSRSKGSSGYDYDDSSTDGSSEDSEGSRAEEEELRQLEALCEQLHQYHMSMKIKRRSQSQSTVGDLNETDNNTSRDGDAMAPAPAQPTTGQGERVDGAAEGTPSAGAPTAPSTSTGTMYDHMDAPSAGQRYTSRSKTMDAYVSRRSEGRGEADLPQWLARYQKEKQRQQEEYGGNRERHVDPVHSRGASDVEPGQEEEEEEGYERVPSVPYSRQSSARTGLSRQSSHYSQASQQPVFLSDEERRQRSAARRRLVEEEVASQRTYTPRLSRPGTPRRIEEIPLSAPGKWEDRLYGEYFSKKKRRQEEIQMHNQNLQERSEMESFIRHCSFTPEINSSSMAMAYTRSDSETAFDQMFRRAREKQQEKAAERQAREEAQAQACKKSKNYKPSEDDVHARLYKQGVKMMEDKRLEEETQLECMATLASQRHGTLTAEEQEDSVCRLYEEAQHRREAQEALEAQAREKYESEMHRPHLNDPYASQMSARSETPVYERLFSYAKEKQDDRRKKELQKMEQETKALIENCFKETVLNKPRR